VDNRKALHITGGLAQLGGKVFARIVMRPLTVGGCPNCVRAIEPPTAPSRRDVVCKQVAMHIIKTLTEQERNTGKKAQSSQFKNKQKNE
jgi:hypothetical protein